MEEKQVAMWLCPKCDRPYYQVSRVEFDENRMKHNAIARSLKSKHKCPWERRKQDGRK